MDMYSPVIIFAYKRKDKLQSCLAALENNDIDIVSHSDLFIYADGYKSEKDYADVLETHKYIEEYANISKFKSVNAVISEHNKGLANSVIEGVTNIVNKYDTIIVVEDDLVVAFDFLKFMNEALRFYKDNHQIGQINGYTYPLEILDKYDKDIFFLNKGDCWGWATWKDRWDGAEWKTVDKEKYLRNKKKRRQFEKLESNWDLMMINQLNGEIDSWAIRWVYYLFDRGYVSVYPSKSLVSNEGFDGSGTHTNNSDEKYDDKYTAEINTSNLIIRFDENIEINKAISKASAKFPRGNVLYYYYNRIRCLMV